MHPDDPESFDLEAPDHLTVAESFLREEPEEDDDEEEEEHDGGEEEEDDGDGYSE